MKAPRTVLLAALWLLAALYTLWFGMWRDWPAVAVFALPPAWLAWRCRTGAARPAFWSGVLALFWFAHGVMVAWTRPPERGFAWVAIVLAVAIVITASLPGLRARFAGRVRPAD